VGIERRWFFPPSGEDEAERRLTAIRAWLQGKPPVAWMWLRSELRGEHDESHDEHGIALWLEQQPEYQAAIRQLFTPDEIASVPRTYSQYSDPLSYDVALWLAPGGLWFPRPQSPEWRIWWKQVGGDPERYWRNEPLFGYPTTVLGHFARWSAAGVLAAIAIVGIYFWFKLKSGQ
jgi:hypothetical protein